MIPSSSLVPENDPTVLFTTAGMQQFKRYYLFPDEAPQARITTCQKCVRTGDIDEVGDETHLTFFEMLGNFSFGFDSQRPTPDSKQSPPYFKEEAIKLAWEFLTDVLKIDKSRIYATYFKDDATEVLEDKESLEILQKIEGLGDIRPQGFDDNFWSLGTEGSPGGPTVEFYVDNVEVWNLVFNEFVLKNNKYEPVELKGVDTGMGLERLSAMMNNAKSVFLTDIFELPHNKLHQFLLVESPIDERIVLDHLRAATFMINDGVEPSNKGQGYILRRLIRRAVVRAHNLKIERNFTAEIAKQVAGTYPEYSFKDEKIVSELEKEETKFRLTLAGGMKIISGQEIFDGKVLFDLYQTSGIPLEIALEEIKNQKKEVPESSVEEFRSLLKGHQEKSRTAAAGMFKGGLADNKIETTRLHTAAHLLLSALRRVLGEQVEQKGSNITEERLRFDFNNPEKLTPEQIKQIEDIVNEKISEGLEVVMQEMNLEEAKKSGATGSFSDRYGDMVKIFTIGPMEEPFSREICGGPHVSGTSELGHFKITKEESSSSGVRRIKAVLE